tara:strand:- start:858 stop:1886 length:1029 start_codon:yes stop_codon:yes gene_type:complete
MIKKLDLALKELENTKTRFVITKEETEKIINDVENVNNMYERDKSSIFIEKLKNVRFDSEKIIPVINIQIKNNKRLESQYKNLSKLIDKRKKKYIRNIIKSKHDIIEGINIESAIRNDPTYRAIKRVYDQAVGQLNKIKNQIAEQLKELDKVTKFLKEVKEKLEEALYKAKDIIEKATEKLQEVKEKADKDSKKILSKSEEVLAKAKLDAKTVKLGSDIKVKLIIKEAKGEDTNIGFDEEDKVEKAMKIIAEYDPKLAAKMKREGIQNATEAINEKESDQAGVDAINENADLGSDTDTGMGGAENLVLEPFSNHKKKCKFFYLILFSIVIFNITFICISKKY